MPQLAAGKPGGHLDLPRMRAGGVRGAIFAVFTDGPDERLPGDAADASAVGPAAARSSRSRVGRRSSRPGPPAGWPRSNSPASSRSLAPRRTSTRSTTIRRCRPRPSCTSRERRRSTPSLRRFRSGTRRGCGRSVPSGAGRTGSPTACRSVAPSSPDTGPGLTDAGQRSGRALRRARDPGRPQPPQRAGVLGRGADRRRAARRQPLRRACAVSELAQPDRFPARRDRIVGRPGRDRVRACAFLRQDFADAITTRRSS